MNRDVATNPLAHPCIAQILRSRATHKPNAIAIEAPEHPALTYFHLYHYLEAIALKLRRLGINRRDRVALLLPTGPELITAYLGITSCATSVVLNPACHNRELNVYLPSLSVKGVIIDASTRSRVEAIARAHKIHLIEISSILESAGPVELADGARGKETIDFAQPEDIALVLLTSGTTAHPKQVPVTQAHLCTTALRVCRALQLKESDRCLNIMPAFHSHGLIGAVTSTLISGAP